MNQQNKCVFLALFLAIFIDSIGISLFMPLATPLFMQANGILPIDASPMLRHFYYGLSIGIFSLMGFFGAPLLGSLSDRWGRKRILLICLSATCIGYLLCAYAVFLHSISLLLIGRIIDGFTGGSISIAQAAIVDITPIEKKTTQLGYVLLAASLGFVLGPLIAGLLSNPSVFGAFNIATPLLFAGILAAINFCLLSFYFKETFIPKPIAHHESQSGIIYWVFNNRLIRQLAIVFLLMQLGWATYFEFITLFLAETYHFSTQTLGIFMSGIGVGYVITFCYLLSILNKYFSLKSLALLGLSTLAISIWATLFIRNPIMPWLAVLPAAISLGTTYSVLITLFSNAVDANHQGRMMGFTTAISALSFGGTALVSGLLASVNISIPLILGAICLSIGAGLLIFLKQATAQNQNVPA